MAYSKLQNCVLAWCQAHNLKVVGSNPTPATNELHIYNNSLY